MGQRRVVGMVGGLGSWRAFMDLGHDLGKNFSRLERWRLGLVSHRAGDLVARASGGVEKESIDMGWQMAHGIAGGADVIGDGACFVVVCIVACGVSTGRSQHGWPDGCELVGIVVDRGGLDAGDAARRTLGGSWHQGLMAVDLLWNFVVGIFHFRTHRWHASRCVPIDIDGDAVAMDVDHSARLVGL